MPSACTCSCSATGSLGPTEDRRPGYVGWAAAPASSSIDPVGSPKLCQNLNNGRPRTTSTFASIREKFR